MNLTKEFVYVMDERLCQIKCQKATHTAVKQLLVTILPLGKETNLNTDGLLDLSQVQLFSSITRHFENIAMRLVDRQSIKYN